MNVTLTKEGTRTLVKLDGRIDTTNVEQFQKDIAPLMEDPTPDIELDCTDMAYTSSQGLRVFLMLQKAVTMKGGKLIMTKMQPKVREVFDITGFSNIIRII